MSYSRDPSKLFEPPACGFPPPLNFENNIHNGKQPIRYERQKLRMQMGNFGKPGEYIRVVDINWINGQAIFYQNVEEALNGISSGCIKKFRILTEAPAMIQEYIQETLALLKRGHSLTHPQCSCYHTMCPERCQTLGISHPRSEYNTRRECVPCPLTRRPREFTSQEVSDELGIEDVLSFELSDAVGKKMPLLHILSKFCHLRMEGAAILFSCLDFDFAPLQDMHGLLRKLSSNPLPQVIHLQSYAKVKKDVAHLVESGTVHALQPRSDEITLFYFNPRWDIGPIDKDVVALWHSVDPKEMKRELNTMAEPKYASHHWHQMKPKNTAGEQKKHKTRDMKKKRKKNIIMLTNFRIKKR